MIGWLWMAFRYHFVPPDNPSCNCSAIQLTGTAMDPNSWFGTAGRVTHPEVIHLQGNTSNELYDFTANFSFVVSSNQIPYEDGLAFFLATLNLPSMNVTPQLRQGGLGIGLVDGDKHLIQIPYKFVAVEFDTFSK
ncbi:hypothetical protein RJT34_04241 [Clitoria ternatea]|uniref:Legume lectin domain-containing protein n=1 Tax=Clitoria ternatea TaxID=43366 RepID=A0AAN9Q0F0_CLITE